MFDTGLSTQQVNALIQEKLFALRKALVEVSDLHEWSAGLTVAEMATATGLSAADAGVVQSAIADGSALGDYYATGVPPATYPQPASKYAYGASQRRILGPRLWTACSRLSRSWRRRWLSSAGLSPSRGHW